MRSRRYLAAAAGLGLTVAAVSGCTQVAQLQPVAGDGVVGSIATNDVLLNANVPVKMFLCLHLRGTNYFAREREAGCRSSVRARRTPPPTFRPYRRCQGERLESARSSSSSRSRSGRRCSYDGPTTAVLRKHDGGVMSGAASTTTDVASAPAKAPCRSAFDSRRC
jgi:hypothetical protein